MTKFRIAFVVGLLIAIYLIIPSPAQAACKGTNEGSDCKLTCDEGFTANLDDCIYRVTGDFSENCDWEYYCMQIGSGRNSTIDGRYCKYDGSCNIEICGQTGEHQWAFDYCRVGPFPDLLEPSDCTDNGGRLTTDKQMCYLDVDASTVYWCEPVDIVRFCSCIERDTPEGRIPSPVSLTGDFTLGDDFTLGTVIKFILPFIPILVGLILLVMIVLGGIKVATSRENEEQKQKGLKTVTNALIGAAVVFLAVVIISVLEMILGITILYGFRG